MVRFARRAGALAVLSAVSACFGLRRGDVAPTLDTISPDSAVFPAGGVVGVTLTGTGFLQATPGENIVRLGPATLRGVSATADGRRITFNLPDVVQTDGEAPPARLESGSYAVQVETAAGKSNELTIRIFR